MSTMNKKNLPIFISLLVVSLFFTVVFYYAYTIITSNNSHLRAQNFYDARLSENLPQEEIDMLNGLDEIEIAGGSSAKAHSARYKGQLLSLVGQDLNVNQMREYSYLMEGRFPKSRSEIVLNETLVEKEGLILGDTVELELGKRLIEGEEIDARSVYTDQETFETTGKQTFTLVGVYRDFYNENLKINYGLSIVQDDERLVPLINFKYFEQAYEDKEDIQTSIRKLLDSEIDLEFNDTLVHFYGLDVSPAKNMMTQIINISSLILCVVIFVFFIKNIFWVWGVRKIRELSIYKSIGSTDFQIYHLLLKEAVTISILPILVGHFLGFIFIRYLFERAISIQDETPIYNLVQFNGILSLVIILTAIVIVLLAVIYPARKIAKINIIDGIKGNFSFSRKDHKKSSANLWDELRINNLASIKSQRYISSIGILIIAVFCILFSISNYIRDFYTFDDGYDLTVKYYSQSGSIPKVLQDILADFDVEGFISKEKYIAVEPNLELSQAAKAYHLDKKLAKKMEDVNQNYITGTLIAMEVEDLKKLGGQEGKYTLYNQVQANPHEPIADAETVQYFENPQLIELTVNAETDEKTQAIQVADNITELGVYQIRILPFTVVLFTDFSTFNQLMDSSNYDKHMNYSFVLKLNVPAGEQGHVKQEISRKIENAISYNESFNIYTKEELRAAYFTDIESFRMIIYGIAAIIFLLNITNGYSAINLSLLSRRKEFGTLYTIGMDSKALKKRFNKEFLFEQLKSFLLSVVISLFLMMIIAQLYRSVNIKALILYFPYVEFLVFSGLVYGLNLLIYRAGLNLILSYNPIELIKGT